MRKAQVAEPTRLGGFPCRGWVEFHRGGSVSSFELSEDATLQGHLLPEGSRVWVDLNGRLEHCWLSRDALLQGVPCRGGGEIDVSFHRDGSLRTLFLAEDRVLHGIPCRASLFDSVILHPGGRVESATLARAAEIDGVFLQRGTRVRLDPYGRLLEPR